MDNTPRKKGYRFLFWQQVSEIMALFQISSTNISLVLLGAEATDMQSTIPQIFEEITLNWHANIVLRQRKDQMQGPEDLSLACCQNGKTIKKTNIYREESGRQGPQETRIRVYSPGKDQISFWVQHRFYAMCCWKSTAWGNHRWNHSMLLGLWSPSRSMITESFELWEALFCFYFHTEHHHNGVAIGTDWPTDGTMVLRLS